MYKNAKGNSLSVFVLCYTFYVTQKKKSPFAIFVGLTVAIVILAFVGYQFKKQSDLSKIDSYDECAEAGFPIMESYPPRCQVPGGQSFTQEIGNELDYHDEFIISSPRPNQKISSPLTIEGKARGSWYFEGSFSGELFDSENNSLGTVILTAQGEWMTEEFVPFKGTLEFKPVGLKGKLILENANPSGMEENAKKIEIPVTF